MRVVAGSARGRRLTAPRSPDVRPTSDRVREALFASLGSLGVVEGAKVLDLFAGSGALAIEALSRGAESAVLVERDRSALEAMRANLAAAGVADRAKVVAGDAMAKAAGLAGDATERGPRFDLVLLDPPYRYDGWRELLEAVRGLAEDGATVVLESDREVAVPEGWAILRDRRYGGTFVRIATLPSPSALASNPAELS